MKNFLPVKSSAKILRDLSTHSKPLNLPNRRSKAQEIYGPQSVPHAGMQDAPISKFAAPPAPDRPATQLKISTDRYQEGFSAGQKDGSAKAAAEAEETYQRRLLQEIDSLGQQKFDECKAAGFKEGLEEGLKAAAKNAAESQAELHKLRMQLERLAGLLSEKIDSYALEAEDEIVAFCFSVICRILGDHAVTPAGVRGMLNSLLSQHRLSPDSDIAVHLHPADLAVLQMEEDGNESSPRIESLATKSNRVKWLADKDVKLGGLMIRSAAGSLDARLEIQIQALKMMLLNTRAASGNTAVSPQRELVPGVNIVQDMPPPAAPVMPGNEASGSNRPLMFGHLSKGKQSAI